MPLSSPPDEPSRFIVGDRSSLVRPPGGRRGHASWADMMMGAENVGRFQREQEDKERVVARRKRAGSQHQSPGPCVEDRADVP